jgi:hypothetical protein
MNVEIFGHCFPADEKRIAKRGETSRWIFITVFFLLSNLMVVLIFIKRSGMFLDLMNSLRKSVLLIFSLLFLKAVF